MLENYFKLVPYIEKEKPKIFLKEMIQCSVEDCTKIYASREHL